MLPLGLMLFFASSPSDETNPAAGMAALAAFAVVYIVIFIVIMAIYIFIHWRVAVKSGYPGVYSLLLLIPVVNIVIMLIWVFSEWPIEAELRHLRAQLGLPPGRPVGTTAIPTAGGSTISNP